MAAEMAGGRLPRNRRIDTFAIRRGRLMPLSDAFGSCRAAACHTCAVAADAGEKSADLLQIVPLKEFIPFSNSWVALSANANGVSFG